MYQITDVAKHLLIINLLAFVGSLLLGSPIDGPINNFWDLGRLAFAVYYPSSEFFRPFQLVTHMFMHGDAYHLLFNMLGLYMFGSGLEMVWGPRKFLFYYLFAGFGGVALHIFVRFLQIQYGDLTQPEIFMGNNTPMLGASGAIFGLLVGYGFLFPNNVITLLFPPIPMKAKYFVMIFAGLELYLGVSGYQSGVAHFTHLGGALFGFLLLLYWQRFGSRL
jgi:membrane associated rhomboid family serine protease